MRASILWGMALVTLLWGVGPAWAQTTYTRFDPSMWSAPDAALGIAGANIESFEDVNLANGLMVSAVSSLGSYGPTATLPRVFRPATEFPGAFSTGAWDGLHTLTNTGTNGPGNPAFDSTWGDVTLHFGNGGARQVGFSLQNNERTLNILINGVFQGTLQSLAGSSLSSGTNGYFRIDALGGAPAITSLTFDNTSGDGFTIDHVAFRMAEESSAVPEPSALLLFLPALAVMALLRKSRRVSPRN